MVEIQICALLSFWFMEFNNIFTCGLTQIAARKQPANRKNHPDYNFMEVETCINDLSHIHDITLFACF